MYLARHGSILVLPTCPTAEGSLSWKERGAGLRPRDCSCSCRQRLRSNSQGQVSSAILYLPKAADLSPDSSLGGQTAIPNSAPKCPLRVRPTEAWLETAYSLWRSQCHWICVMCQARRDHRVQVGDRGGRTRALENVFGQG